MQGQHKNGLCVADQHSKDCASGQQSPWILGVRNGSAEDAEQLPDGDQKEHRPGSILKDLERPADEGEILLHRRHVRSEGIEEQRGYRVHKTGNSVADPIDDALKDPVKQRKSPPCLCLTDQPV